MIPQDQKCNVCGCNLKKMPIGSCGINGRIYVNTAGTIEGIVPPCPRVADADAKFDTIDAFWLKGTVSELGDDRVPVQEQGEVSAAVQFATVLGLLHQDFRTSGLGEDDLSPRQIIGGDPIGNFTRAYCFPELHEDSGEAG
jgi:hypothetical protein